MVAEHVIELLEKAKSFFAQREYCHGIPLLEQAMSIESSNAEIYHLLALAYQKMELSGKAYNILKKAILIFPEDINIIISFARIHIAIKDLNGAVLLYEKALSLEQKHIPDYWNEYIELLESEKQYKKAIMQLDAMISKYGYYNDFLKKLAGLYVTNHQFHEAYHQYQHLSNINPTNLYYKGMLSHLAFKIGTSCEEMKKEVSAFIEINPVNSILNPFMAQIMRLSLYEQLVVAKNWSTSFQSGIQPFNPKPYSHTQIRIGYLISKMHNNPVTLLLGDLLSYHHKEKFISYFFSTTSGYSTLSNTIQNSVQYFFDLSTLSKEEAAKVILRQEIDILIDLTGPLEDHCFDILAYQPAPKQAHWLGYTGTMGADFISYFITTLSVFPKELSKYMHENLIYLPKTDIACQFTLNNKQNPQKNHWKIPTDKFIFQAHHTYYRIDHHTLLTWFEILQQVPESLLWLKIDNSSQQQSIHHLAQKNHVENQLLFYTQDSITELKHNTLCDLFLDPIGFSSGTMTLLNSHMQVPMLTFQGNVPVSRISAQYLEALALPEQITRTTQEYIDRAVYLSNHPDQLLNIKNKLQLAFQDNLLFNPALFIDDLERSLLEIYSMS